MIEYDISKVKGGQYYVHPSGHPEQPIKGSLGEMKKAIKIAARLCGMEVKEYMKERKQ